MGIPNSEAIRSTATEIHRRFKSLKKNPLTVSEIEMIAKCSRSTSRKFTHIIATAIEHESSAIIKAIAEGVVSASTVFRGIEAGLSKVYYDSALAESNPQQALESIIKRIARQSAGSKRQAI